MLPAEELLGFQNNDGGWGYAPSSQQSSSWTEPTCYALLALAAAEQSDSSSKISTSIHRASQWLAARQRSDGGFSPRESVGESTWQTALVLTLPAELSGNVNRATAEVWLLAQTGRESNWLNRVRSLLVGGRSDASASYDGWPWYPGAAAWVTPTAMSILALERIARTPALDGEITKRLQERIDQGRSFLLARRCRDGGWNHGSTKALGYDSDSYPETTGTALLALHGATGPEIDEGLRRGEELLANCKSSEAASWLMLGLLAHGRAPAHRRLELRSRTMETAMAMLADTALQGRNPFLT